MTTDKPDHEQTKDEMGGQASKTNLYNGQSNNPEKDLHDDDEPMMDRLI